jgi:hypothetical protein
MPAVHLVRATAPPTAGSADSEGFKHIGVRQVKVTDNWIVRHGQGELPLWKSYWLVGVLLGLIGTALSTGLFNAVASSGLSRGERIAIVVVVMSTMTAIGIWQIAGIWRAAGNHIERTRGNWRRFWAVLARIACVVGVLQIIGGVLVTLQVIAS